MIDLTINHENLQRNIESARQHHIIIPTFRQMAQPELVPPSIRKRLAGTGLWDVDPVNLFRITWKNEPKATGGLYGPPNVLELPPELTGVPARILCLVGKWFPTGCHKVGASFGCLIPKLVTGQFDVTRHKAVWPSTGNFCRGGAFNAKLLACRSVAVMPAGMSRERFEWLDKIAGEVVAIPGAEANLKAIFDCTADLLANRNDLMVFNQFCEMGNHLWHYQVTGPAIAEAFANRMRPGDRLAGACFAAGSGGTVGCGDYLKERFPEIRIGAGEAVQCPTLGDNGYGCHRIEGIGDRHVPWILDARNLDLTVGIDDEDTIRLIRLFNEPEGRRYLVEEAGVAPELADQLGLVGISGMANILSCIKMAKYYELNSHDMIFSVLTDSIDLYQSRLAELNAEFGPYTRQNAAVDHNRHLLGIRTDAVRELTYPERRKIHNLKYYIWVEQLGKSEAELNALWYDRENTWDEVHRQTMALDEQIEAFNDAVGLLKD
ncbi:MAG: pyridoxal-phosphate dependent enzyme [Lentisphaeria bacterium]|nr:pyridoxal-phosphate dependent enzyme [Lentisphaeria bacterium]